MQSMVVITADIIDSRHHANFAATLKPRLVGWMRPGMVTPFTLSVGDEIQAVCNLTADLPVILRELRLVCHPMLIRIGVGIGTIDDFDEKLTSWDMNGSAFHHARSALLRISETKLPQTMFSGDDTYFVLTLNTIYALVDHLMGRWTDEQWAAVSAYERHATYSKAAEILQIARQNVQKRCQAAHWPLLKNTEGRIGDLIQYYRNSI